MLWLNLHAIWCVSRNDSYPVRWLTDTFLPPVDRLDQLCPRLRLLWLRNRLVRRLLGHLRPRSQPRLHQHARPRPRQHLRGQQHLELSRCARLERAGVRALRVLLACLRVLDGRRQLCYAGSGGHRHLCGQVLCDVGQDGVQRDEPGVRMCASFTAPHSPLTVADSFSTVRSSTRPLPLPLPSRATPDATSTASPLFTPQPTSRRVPTSARPALLPSTARRRPTNPSDAGEVGLLLSCKTCLERELILSRHSLQGTNPST